MSIGGESGTMTQQRSNQSGKLGTPGRRNRFWIAVIAIGASLIWLLFFGFTAATADGPARGASIAMVVLGLCYLAACAVYVHKVVLAPPPEK